MCFEVATCHNIETNPHNSITDTITERDPSMMTSCHSTTEGTHQHLMLHNHRNLGTHQQSLVHTHRKKIINNVKQKGPIN